MTATPLKVAVVGLVVWLGCGFAILVAPSAGLKVALGWLSFAGLVALVVGAVMALVAAARRPRGPSDLDELEQLGRLRQQGVLTQQEFEARKAQIIGEQG